MKKINFTLALIGLAGLSLLAGCDSKETKTPTAKTPAKAVVTLPNYRYVDIDTILSKYNLAKDYQDEMIRMQNDYENAFKRHQNQISAKAQQVQNKLQNNAYLSKSSYESDEKELGTMQQNAQRSMATLENNMNAAAMQGQKAVNDSIEAFIQEYNKTRGYDAILLKGATVYINPALDITDEVVEGLNARYNKVSKK